MLPAILGGLSLLNMLNKNDQQKRQSLIDEVDAKWSGLKAPSGSKAPDKAEWINDITALGTGVLGAEMKSPGSFAKADEALSGWFGGGKNPGAAPEVENDFENLYAQKGSKAGNYPTSGGY